MILSLGEIYQSQFMGGIKEKVIGFDEYEVLLDDYLERHKSHCIVKNLKRKSYFSRTAVDLFLKNSRKIGFEKLTDEEMEILKPNLPIRTCRYRDISWTDEDLINKINFKKTNTPCIKTPKIWLYPIGPKGRIKNGEIIEAENEDFFTIVELLKKAMFIQKKANQKPTNGIGVYRAGIQSQIPSYYIGEYYDMTSIMQI